MKKNKIKEWRNSLVDPIMIQFTALKKKNSKKFRKRLEKDIDNTIDYYLGLLTKKQRKTLGPQQPVTAPSPGIVNISDKSAMANEAALHQTRS